MPDQTPAPPSYRDPDTAPFIYFDLAATFGILAGEIQVELAARVLRPIPSGGVATDFMTTARLRCSPAAAVELHTALEKALEMLQQPDQTAGAGTLQ
jgi:hypothetical protein